MRNRTRTTFPLSRAGEEAEVEVKVEVVEEERRSPARPRLARRSAERSDRSLGRGDLGRDDLGGEFGGAATG